MLARNRLANVSFLVCSLGELVVLAILAGILEGVINDDPDSNTKALSIVCAYSAGVWSESLLFIVWPWLTKINSLMRYPMAAVRAIPPWSSASSSHDLFYRWVSQLLEGINSTMNP